MIVIHGDVMITKKGIPLLPLIVSFIMLAISIIFIVAYYLIEWLSVSYLQCASKSLALAFLTLTCIIHKKYIYRIAVLLLLLYLATFAIYQQYIRTIILPDNIYVALVLLTNLLWDILTIAPIIYITIKMPKYVELK